MNLDFMFFINSIFLGVGLAMDAFSVSMANGLNEPNLKKKKLATIAGMFSFFQALMPMIGWLCIKTVANYFNAFEKCIPYIALILLLYIGGKMIYDGIKNTSCEKEPVKLGFVSLLVQGIATSIDALSVGFTIADYDLFSAFVCSLIIAAVTFVICSVGLIIGKKCSEKLSGKSQFLGGGILIFIGLEIFITSIF